MYTVIETPAFSRLVVDYWSDEEREDFAVFLANNPEFGDVVPGSGGVRKIRWSRQGSGKRGGVRVIYYNKLNNGEIWQLLIYAKSAKENIPSHILKAIKEEIEND